MRPILVATAVLLATVAPAVHGQGVATFSGFQQASAFGGYQHVTTFDILLRNVNSYTDDYRYSMGSTFSVVASERVVQFCQSVVSCNLISNSYTWNSVGNVQRGNMTFNGQDFQATPGWSEDSCNAARCTQRLFFFGFGGILGCQTPTSAYAVAYVARTCAADGFDGGIGRSMRFTYETASPLALSLTADDFSVRFHQQSTVVPEPSTYALMVVGLVGLLVVRRKRKP